MSPPPRGPKSFSSKDLRRFCTANCVPKKTGPKPRELVPILRHAMQQRKNQTQKYKLKHDVTSQGKKSPPPRRAEGTHSPCKITPQVLARASQPHAPLASWTLEGCGQSHL
jgi:hypothetical protein